MGKSMLDEIEDAEYRSFMSTDVVSAGDQNVVDCAVVEQFFKQF